MTTPADSIRIHPGNLSDAMSLRSTTALGDCTTLDSDDAGLFVTRNYPRLSSGEELLWATFAWLNGSGNLPSMDDLRAGLDGPNFRAVSNLLRTSQRVTA